MSNRNLEIHRPEAFAAAAARCVAAELEVALSIREKATFVLAGGSTPSPVYELLAGVPYRNRIDWNRIEFFWGDERCVPPESPDSNFGMARITLLAKLQISPKQIHRIAGELENAERAAVQYEREIMEVVCGQTTCFDVVLSGLGEGICGEVPSFDVVLLGMGEDGHTASLFPGTSWNQDRLVIASCAPKLKVNRVSMTPRLLNEAQSIIFLVAGSAKAEALARVFLEPDCELPAARIRPSRGRMTWIVDSEAASKLNGGPRTDGGPGRRVAPRPP